MLAGVVVLGTVGVVAASVPDVGKTIRGYFGAGQSDVVLFTVAKTKLAVTVKERGNIESSKNLDVINEVEGQTTIISIKPEGTPVKKGEVVAELDSATLRNSLTDQEIATRRAEADHQNAVKTREVAEIAVNEYTNGTFPQESRTIEGEETLAKSDLLTAIDRLNWTKEMQKLGYVSSSQLLAAQQAQMKAQIQQTNAQGKKRLLTDYTYKRETKELEANVEKARADELAKESTLRIEKTKEEKLRKQIDKCILRAPGDGIVVYANDNNNFRGNNQQMIEEGAAVRERQKIFSLPDINHMQVNTKVHESMVNLVQPGQRALILVESNADRRLDGTVKTVATMADQGSWMSSDIKMYTTLVTIDTTGVSNLRPGMTAEVEILISQLDDVLAVPVQAILPFQGKDYVYVATGDGHRRVPVTLGITNDKLIEIKDGLKEGDKVVLNPMSLLTEEEKREAAASSSKDADKKEFGKVAPGATPGPALSPGLNKGGPDAKAKSKAKGKRGGGGAMFAKFRNISPEDREKLKDASEEERKEIMKKAGFTDEELEAMQRMRESGGGPGGPGGGFGGGRGPDGGGSPQ